MVPVRIAILALVLAGGPALAADEPERSPASPDGASAGGHFNPGGHQHALPTGNLRHLGDLGNITVGADGKGTLEILATGANLKDGDPSSFLGRAVIIHEKKDDGGQPTELTYELLGPRTAPNGAAHRTEKP